MKTHPSSESPNAAPDKSLQATEKTQTCLSKTIQQTLKKTVTSLIRGKVHFHIENSID